MPILVLYILVTAGVSIVCWWRIYWRMGLPSLMALLMVIPVANLAVLLYIAFTRWPIEERLDSLQTDLKRMRGEL